MSLIRSWRDPRFLWIALLMGLVLTSAVGATEEGGDAGTGDEGAGDGGTGDDGNGDGEGDGGTGDAGGTGSSGTGATGEEEQNDSLIRCFTCGDATVDPVADGGSYCDLTKDDGCAADIKMYNHTCDIMDELGASDAWTRDCPAGVQSCFWAQGRYEGQEPIFRGCAGAHYQHDHACTRELQAVSVVTGRSSVDVEVHLCYCNEDECNENASGADRVAVVAAASAVQAALLSAVLARIIT